MKVQLFYIKLLVLLLVGVVASCMPQKGKDKTSCGTNQEFNPLTRKCYSVEAPRTVPVANLTEVTITEDSGVNNITLNYTDKNSDYAVACNIISYSSTIDGNGALPVSCSCTGGVCTAKVKPDNNFNGLAQFIYTVLDQDGESNQRIVKITVTSVDDKPVANLLGSDPVMGGSIDEDETKTFTLGYTDVESDWATSCQINAISANITIQSSCYCLFGTCQVSIKGIQDYYGAGEYVTYQVYANGQWSNSATLIFDINSINDKPVAPADFTVVMTEDEYESGGGANFFTASAGTDVDGLLTDLRYNIVTPETKVNIINCLTGAAVPLDLECELDASALVAPPVNILHLNDDFLHATVAIRTYTDAFITDASPSMRFRAVNAGTAGNNIRISFEGGGVAGSEVVTVDTSTSPIVLIKVTIQDGVSTSYQIKKAIDDDPTASGYVEVFLQGSMKETSSVTTLYVDGDGCTGGPVPATDCTWPVALAGGVDGVIDYLEYDVTDTAGAGLTSNNKTKVSFSITPVNDAPTAPAGGYTYTGTEDGDIEFTLEAASNLEDVTDVLSYRLVTDPSVFSDYGEIKDCMNLDGTEGPSDLTCTFTPKKNISAVGGINALIAPSTLQYEVYDGGTPALIAGPIDFDLDIAESNDMPMLCQYSNYNQSPECDLAGCIGTSSPVGRIAPSKHSSSKSVYYFDSSSSICYRSTGTTNADWEEDINGNIFDVSLNQDEIITLSSFGIDEGGGSGEDGQEIKIRNFITDNPSLIPDTNVIFTYSGTSVAANTAPPLDLDAGAADAAAGTFTLKITPIAGQVGEANISFELFDDAAVDPKYITLSFKVTVNSSSAVHKGWANIKATGPRTDPLGKPLDSKYVCSFSRSLCNSGGECLGTSAPGSGDVPDDLGAIYLNQTDPANPDCYRATMKKAIQGLTYEAKTNRKVLIRYNSGGVFGTTTITTRDTTGTSPATLSTAGGSINDDDAVLVDVLIASGATTTDMIATAIAADPVAGALLKITNDAYSTPQTSFTTPALISIKGGSILMNKDIIYVGMNENPISLELIGSSSEAILGVTGQDVQIRVNNTGSNDSTLATLINGSSLMNTFIRAIPLNAGGTLQSGLTKTTLSATAANFTWESFDIYCAVTEGKRLQDCRDKRLGGSCMGYGPPDSSGYTIVPTEFDQRYYDLSNKVCYRSNGHKAGGNEEDVDDADDWESYKATGEVTLTWNDFEVAGAGGITGYNIYRKLANPNTNKSIDWDYTTKINFRDISSTNTFVDNYANSRLPPAPNTVYFYEIRPLVDGVEAVTNENFSKIRIISPPTNMAFVHRWIVNQTICSLMHSEERTDVADPTEYTMKDESLNYRCKYHGPGETDVGGGLSVYDIGYDLLVDRYEAGCPYSKSGCELTTDGTCIGTADPTLLNSSAAPNANMIYYNRTNGKCFMYTGAGWGAFEDGNAGYEGADASAVVKDDGANSTSGQYNAANIPPIVNVNQRFAYDFCAGNSFVADVDATPTDDVIMGLELSGVDLNKTLPTRKEQMAYSQWPTSDDLSDSDIENIEMGLSLNSSSKCNSSQASGYSSSYSDVRVPDVNSFFTLPGTASSQIRSVVTGSDVTSACQSMFGIQDVIGNVAEFVSDRFRCRHDDIYGANLGLGGSHCQAVHSGNAGENPNIAQLDTATDYYLTSTVNDSAFPHGEYSEEGNGTRGEYSLDGIIGPCAESGTQGCDTPLTSWTIDLESNNASRISVPMGLPFTSAFNPTAYPTSEAAWSILDIGPSNGISSSQFHDDEWHFNSEAISGEEFGCGSMTVGGSYKSSTGAGVWNLEMVPCYNNVYQTYSLWNAFQFRATNTALNTIYGVIAFDSYWSGFIDGYRMHFNWIDGQTIFNIMENGSAVNQGYNDASGGGSPPGDAWDNAPAVFLVSDGYDTGTNYQSTAISGQTSFTNQPYTDNSSYSAISPSIGFRCLYRINSSTNYVEAQ